MLKAKNYFLKLISGPIKTKPQSIKAKLIRNLSFSISVVLFIILLASDRGIDGWLNSEFDRTLFNKSGLLITLVDEDIEGIEFEFSDEFMPEFSVGKDLEYYQLWLDGKPFELSESLKKYTDNNLTFNRDLVLHGHQISDIVLPDGRGGRMITKSFLPQVDSEIRVQTDFDSDTFHKNQKVMQLAYALSTETLNETLVLVDLFFILSLIVAVILVNITVRIVINNGFSSLEDLNSQLEEIKFNAAKKIIRIDNSPLELDAIVNSINTFITENFKLYNKQKRVTSDIAHELKTPITELINLAEVAIRFPADKELFTSFKSEVLAISQRMKNIVNDIMLLQLSSSSANLSKEQFDCAMVLRSIMNNQQIPSSKVDLHFSNEIMNIESNKFAFESIMNNVVCNANYYSPEDSKIQIELRQVEGELFFKISNECLNPLEEHDLEFLFEPLWQKDSSRTAVDRFGLGLSIVESFSKAINAKIKVEVDKNLFVFSLVF